MTITLGDSVTRNLPDTSFGDVFPHDLANGQILLSGGPGLAFFSVIDLDGSVVVAPVTVDDSTVPEVPDPALPFVQAVYAASALPSGGYRVHYMVDDVPLFPLEATHYTRDFDAQGVPLGASVMVPGLSAYFHPENSVTLLTSTGQIALASDAGLTILDPDGSVAGGTDGSGAGFFQVTDEGYDIVESEGRLIMFTSDWRYTLNPIRYFADITAQIYDLDGNPIGDPVSIAENIERAGYDINHRARVDADVLADGRIVVVFGDLNAPGEDGVQNFVSTGGIGALILNPDLSIDVPLFAGNPNTLAEGQYQPRVHALDAGGFVISYESDDDVQATTAVLRVQEFAADGTPVGDPAFLPLELTSQLRGQTNSIIGRDGAGLLIDEDGEVLAIDVEASGGGGNAGINETGADGPDTMVGTDGDDTLDGGAGDDVIAGGDGDDSLSGGAGNDEISGSDGSDTIDGGADDDNIGGGLGDDDITGGLGNDTMGAGQGNDAATGDEGDDGVFGGAGDDTLDGGAGNDTMGAGFNNDIVNGGVGDDLMGGGTGRDTVDGGAGSDAIGGGEGNDTMTGGTGDDTVNGGGRDDIVDGGAGNDQVNGGAGNDTATGGAGADLFVFNAFEDGATDVITDWTDGEDMFRMTGVMNEPGTGLAGKVAALGATQVGANVQMSYGGNTIVLQNADAGDIGVEDFLFL